MTEGSAHARAFAVASVRAAKRSLRKALAELDRPLQRLPDWVVVGALVEWVGDRPHAVYQVTSVDRRRPWSFTGEALRSFAAKSTSTMRFAQERGRRYWRKFRKRQLSL